MEQTHNTMDATVTSVTDPNIRWNPDGGERLENNADPDVCLEKEQEFAAMLHRYNCKVQAMRELRPYSLFVLVLFLNVFLNPPKYPFDQNNAMTRDVAMEPIIADSYGNAIRTWETVRNTTHLYNFLAGPLVDSFWFSGSSTVHGYWDQFNTLLGGVAIRQVRVPTTGCNDYFGYHDVFGDGGVGNSGFTCYKEVSEKNVLTAATWNSYTYRSGDYYTNGKLSGFGKATSFATGMVYPNGGYTEILTYDTTAADARTKIRSLESNGFIDQGTRAIVIEFSTFNPVTRLANVPQFLFEVTDTGTIYTQVKLRSVGYARIGIFNSSLQGYMIMCARTLFSVYVLYFTVITVMDIKNQGPRNYVQQLQGIHQDVSLKHQTTFDEVFRELRRENGREGTNIEQRNTLTEAGIKAKEAKNAAQIDSDEDDEEEEPGPGQAAGADADDEGGPVVHSDLSYMASLEAMPFPLESPNENEADRVILLNRQALFRRLIDSVEVRPRLFKQPYVGSPTYLTIFTWKLWHSVYRGITLEEFRDSLRVQKFQTWALDFNSIAWEYLDLLNIIMLWIQTILLVTLIASNASNIDLDHVAKNYTNLQSMAAFVEFYGDFLGLNVMISSFKLLKYLQVQSDINSVWQTFVQATTYLSAFLMIFVIIFFAYVFAGMILYGDQLRGLHWLYNSMITMLQAMMSSLDADALHDSNPIIGVLFVISFLWLVVLVPSAWLGAGD
eukprot:TRINITY_DN23706_c0_g1_i4.p1 TRINITY_DN23706_c0_g1~~TRINITY_DN23706_c0_g1_i4.p1  ORF type:complete len:724 (+),score=173.75 TRINITY_DN23706_c0_g1_i4:432-2603(+)